MKLYGERYDTTEKRTFWAIRSALIGKIISIRIQVVDPLKPFSTRPGFPKWRFRCPSAYKPKCKANQLNFPGQQVPDRLRT